MAEMEQSMRIIEQALGKLPKGPVNVEDPRFVFSAQAGGLHDH